ncbi:MAG: NAD(+)/NADH kinase [Acidimicrobiales bacterium]
MLRTVELVSADDVPVLGVNAGQLGYLVEIEPDALRPSIERFFSGDHHIEQRMRLDVRRAGRDARSRPSTRPCWRRPRPATPSASP